MTRNFTATFRLAGNAISAENFTIAPGQTIAVGNRKSSADLRVNSDSVSRKHLFIALDADGNLLVCDADSSNGSYVAGRALATSGWHRISPADPIQLGPEVELKIWADENAPSLVLSDRTILAGASAGVETIGQTAVASGMGIARLLEFKERVLIGRSPDSDLVVNDSMSSRRHAEIRRTPDGKILITDLGSSNGTFVDGHRISKPTPIAPGSRIMVGHHVLRWDGQARNLSNEVAVIGHGVAFDYQPSKRALHPASIEIQSGAMTAIMGPSGCGKSTLLKILNGEMLPTEGRVEIFGLDLVEDNEYLRTVIGYVPQDDIVHPELTVEQAIDFAARLRLDGRSSEEISQRVEEVIADLKITHIRGNRVSNISGGQRKRVCIAVELLSSPLMLFLDEPTSPLDPQVIEDFLGILKNLVSKGTTVVMVTHKPEDLAFMENVIFMAEGGHLAFAGPARSHLDHFGASRTTEVYARLAGPEGARHAEGYRQARPPGVSGTKAASVKLKLLQVNQARQFFWLVMRFLTIKTNDKWNTAILLVQAPLVAGLICLIFQQIVAPVLFLTVISMVWFGTNNSAREIVGERSVFHRERMFNLRILPYYASKLLVLGILGFIQALLFVAVITAGYAIREANPGFTNPVGAVLWLTGVCLVGTTMGLLVSASMNNIEKVMSVVPLVLIPQIMLAGFIATISNGLVEALSFLMIARWANEGLTNIQLEVSRLGLNGLPGKVDGLQELLPKFGENYRELFGDAAGTLPLDLWFLTALALSMAAATMLIIRKK